LSATATSMASSAIVTVPPQLDSVLPSSSKLSDTHAPSTKRPWTPQLMPVPEEDATPSAQPRHSQRIQKLQNGLASKRLREGGLDSEDQDYFLSSQELTTADGEESTGTTVVMSYADALRPFRSDDLAGIPPFFFIEPNQAWICRSCCGHRKRLYLCRRKRSSLEKLHRKADAPSSVPIT